MTVHRLTLALIFTFFSLLVTTISSLAAEATFSWLPNEEPITGYKIHYGTESRNYNYVIDVGLPTAIDGRVSASVDGLMEGQTYYFAATAYTGAEESDYSGEVIYTVLSSTGTVPPVVSDISLQGNEDAPLSGQLYADSPVGTALEFT
ncbi:MAG: fibronectin type III domain-containing protein, partial [Desulfobulbaceae bacterium]|nr:fibronectin type III domain-containing protein [Desulfobulbaceae bacterium]